MRQVNKIRTHMPGRDRHSGQLLPPGGTIDLEDRGPRAAGPSVPLSPGKQSLPDTQIDEMRVKFRSFFQ